MCNHMKTNITIYVVDIIEHKLFSAVAGDNLTPKGQATHSTNSELIIYMYKHCRSAMASSTSSTDTTRILHTRENDDMDPCRYFIIEQLPYYM